MYRGKTAKLKETLHLIEADKLVYLSSLKNKFYKNLDKFKEKLYDSLDKGGVFDGKPDKVKQKWVGIAIILYIAVFFVLIKFGDSTGNYYPMIPLFVLAVPTTILAAAMPRRKALGYNLYRQIKGLSFYLGKGKWREEVNEKHLFFAEMLPLAISLEVVNKLAKDMEGLGIKSPDYIVGTTAGSLSLDLTSFKNTAASTLISSPGGKWSGSSSWSGGSGFSGGSSGRGFGGGGGGSW